MLPFVWNVFKSSRYGEPVTVDDPWGYGNSLEWATSCPPPRHNFTELPRIRSERPAFELHYPHMVERIRDEAHVRRTRRRRIKMMRWRSGNIRKEDTMTGQFQSIMTGYSRPHLEVHRDPPSHRHPEG